MTKATHKHARRPLESIREEDANLRTIPEDILRLRPSAVYVVASCNRARTAEPIVRQLLDFGFERNELVLVSNRVHTLRPYPDEEPVEVVDSLRVAEESGGVLGVVTGACFGALLGLLCVSVIDRFEGQYALGVLVGGVVGALLGIALGRMGARMIRRRPDALYDEQLEDDQILLGVGIAEVAYEARADAAARILRDGGLKPNLLRGEEPPTPAELASESKDRGTSSKAASVAPSDGRTSSSAAT